jgi:hypothetical protein
LCVPASLLDRARGGRSIRHVAREEELGRAGRFPILAEDREQAGREHDVAVLSPLGLADADDHPPTVDVGDAQGHDLGDAETGGRGGHEDGAVLEAVDRLEELSDLVGAQDHGELLRLPGGDEIVQDPVLSECGAVEEGVDPTVVLLGAI